MYYIGAISVLGILLVIIILFIIIYKLINDFYKLN